MSEKIEPEISALILRGSGTPHEIERRLSKIFLLFLTNIFSDNFDNNSLLKLHTELDHLISTIKISQVIIDIENVENILNTLRLSSNISDKKDNILLLEIATVSVKIYLENFKNDNFKSKRKSALKEEIKILIKRYLED